MTQAAWYKQSLKGLGLTHAKAAQLLGVEARTSRRWAAGDRSIPNSAVFLLWLMLKNKLKMADLEKIAKE